MKEGQTDPVAYRFKSWIFYPSEGIIEYRKKELILEPRLARLLSSLLRHRRIARREVLIKDIWPDTIVNEESLNRAISDLRKKLNDFFVQAPQIETIPKVGYRIHVEAAIQKASIGKTVLKIVAYLLFGGVVLIILIRAIRY